MSTRRVFPARPRVRFCPAVLRPRQLPRRPSNRRQRRSAGRAARRSRSPPQASASKRPARPAPRAPTRCAMMDDASRASLIADVKRQLHGRDGAAAAHAAARASARASSSSTPTTTSGSSSYGTAGYIGNGYFITVKHGVIALGQEGAADPRKIVSVKLMYKGRRARGAGRRLRRREGRSRLGRLGDRQGQGADRSAGAERQPGLLASTSPTRSSGSATTTRRASSCRPATSASARRTTW